MFLNFIKLIKTPFTSPAVRFSYFFFNRFNFLKKNKKLSINKKWSAGRGSTGKIIMRTRASLLKKNKLLKINYNFRYTKWAVVSNFHFIPFKNKLVTLLLFANGGMAYINTTEFHQIFSYLYYDINRKVKFLKHKNIFLMLCQLKKLSFVSLVELYPGKNAQYVRSSGTGARLLKLDERVQTALIELPSGVKKIFSLYSMVFLGRIVLKSAKKFTSSKAGYWRLFGSKSIVRGVAKNPVDHPHGGRTKSVKYPRTPWGKTTKFK